MPKTPVALFSNDTTRIWHNGRQDSIHVSSKTMKYLGIRLAKRYSMSHRENCTKGTDLQETVPFFKRTCLHCDCISFIHLNILVNRTPNH